MKNTANDTKVLLREKRTKGVKEALKTITTYNSALLGNLFNLFMYGISVDGQLLIFLALVQSHSPLITLPFFDGICIIFVAIFVAGGLLSSRDFEGLFKKPKK